MNYKNIRQKYELVETVKEKEKKKCGGLFFPEDVR